MGDETLARWADAEMIAEFKHLEDVDCLRLDVWIGGVAQSRRDASSYLPRLLELATIGLAVDPENDAVVDDCARQMRDKFKGVRIENLRMYARAAIAALQTRTPEESGK